jgi:membrane protease YdiL (CAAX protease family)
LLKGDIASEFVPYLLLFLFSFGPSLSGVLVTAIFKGKQGLADLLRRLVKVHISALWILVIVAIPLLLNIISLILGYIISGFQPIEFNFLVPIIYFVPFLLFTIVFTGLSEEIGWRG